MTANPDLRMFPEKRQIPDKKPPSFILYPYELYAKMAGTFEEKEAESYELIKNHLQLFKRPYIASSHGKDSIVMVHLVWRACQELGIEMPEVWLNHTLNVYKEERGYWDLFNKWLDIEDRFHVFYPPEDEKGNRYTVWSIAKKVGHLPSFRKTARHTKGGYKQANTPECCDILKKKSIKVFLKGLPKDQRFDLVFVGTRAQESSIRRLGVLQRCRSYFVKYRTAYPIRTLTPLSFWKAVDILEYFHRYNMPKNPTYEIHNMDRMGCASCPAHIGWEVRLAKDPTSEGFGMLKMNLGILKKTDLDRFNASIETLHKYLKSKKSLPELSEANRVRLIKLLHGFGGVTLHDFVLPAN